MKLFVISLARSAEKSLKQLPEPLKTRIIKSVQALAHDPQPVGCKKMAGTRSTYRIRIQNYRVVYDLDQYQITILVLKIAHRREVYR